MEYDGAFVSASFGAKFSRDQSSAKEFFSSGKGMMLIAEAKCYTHWLRIHKVKLPKVRKTHSCSPASSLFKFTHLPSFLTASSTP